ncbi:MAG TPA: hypothetical protein VFZ73_08805 [Gemmatimonadaceae bacterium]
MPNEKIVREKARNAIVIGKLPRRRPIGRGAGQVLAQHAPPAKSP